MNKTNFIVIGAETTGGANFIKYITKNHPEIYVLGVYNTEESITLTKKPLIETFPDTENSLVLPLNLKYDHNLLDLENVLLESFASGEVLPDATMINFYNLGHLYEDSANTFDKLRLTSKLLEMCEKSNLNYLNISSTDTFEGSDSQLTQLTHNSKLDYTYEINCRRNLCDILVRRANKINFRTASIIKLSEIYNESVHPYQVVNCRIARDFRADKEDLSYDIVKDSTTNPIHMNDAFEAIITIANDSIKNKFTDDYIVTGKNVSIEKLYNKIIENYVKELPLERNININFNYININKANKKIKNNYNKSNITIKNNLIDFVNKLKEK